MTLELTGVEEDEDVEGTDSTGDKGKPISLPVLTTQMTRTTKADTIVKPERERPGESV